MKKVHVLSIQFTNPKKITGSPIIGVISTPEEAAKTFTAEVKSWYTFLGCDQVTYPVEHRARLYKDEEKIAIVSLDSEIVLD